jgi:cytochrome P450
MTIAPGMGDQLVGAELVEDPYPFYEQLRQDAPVWRVPGTDAFFLGGVEIPDRAMVALLWGAANRDGSVFERPDEVVLGRPNVRQHVGFGRGIHYCVGAPLARLESRVVLTKLLQRTRRFVLDPDRPPRWVDSLWIRRHERLPVVVERA